MLAHRFDKLEATAGAEEDLLALKRRMGLAPPAPAPQPVRVEAGAPPQGETAEQAELARALSEYEAEERRELTAKR